MGAVSGSRGVCKFWNSSWSMHAEVCTSPVWRKPPLGGQAPHALRPVTEPREARAAAVTVKPLVDCSFRSFPPRHLARRTTVREGATLKLLQLCQSQFHAGPEGGAPLATPQFCQVQGLPHVSRVVSMTTPQFCASSATSPMSLTNSHHLTRHCATVSTPSPHDLYVADPTTVDVMHLRPGSSSSARGLLIWATSEENGNRET